MQLPTTELAPSQQDDLRTIINGRVSFDKVERALYSQDLGTVPGLFRPLLGDTTPAAVAQPETEAELVELVKWSKEHGVPLTPRGRSTAGYGGALALKGGVTVDFTRLNRVFEIDQTEQTATVEPGVVWQELDEHLAGAGLTLRLYPSSYPSSTVGGWLAQEGVGYGSHEYGWFSQNVLRARLVRPDGEVQEMEGKDLELVCGAEGVTGLVSQVTLRAQAATDLRLFGVSFADAKGMGAFVRDLSAQSVPVWSLSFLNPTMAALKNALQIPPLPHHQAPHRPALPQTYVGLVASPEDKSDLVEKAVGLALLQTAGSWLDHELSVHEWENRFRILEIKRHGPSLIPAEVVVPTDRLGEALRALERRVRQPLALEGMSVGRKETVLLGFIPHDERTFRFNLAYAASLTVSKVAEQHGGRAYATGLYFPGEARRVHGAERLDRIRDFKDAYDANGLMNPGKLGQGSRLGGAIAAAKALELVARPLANLSGLSPLHQRPEEPQTTEGIVCSRCGYCLAACPTFEASRQEGLSARGRVALAKTCLSGELEPSAEIAARLFSCTTCMACTNSCPLSVQTVSMVEAARARLAGAGSLPEVHRLIARSLRQKANPYDQDPSERVAALPKPIRELLAPRVGAQAETMLFFGCVASLADMRIAPAAIELMEASGRDYTTQGPDETCCGYISHLMGETETFAETAKTQLARFRQAGIRQLVSPCAGCAKTFKELYAPFLDFELEALHLLEYLAKCASEGALQFTTPLKQRVAYHDPCDLGRHLNLFEPPRALLAAIPDLELVEFPRNRDEARCCGGGGGVQGFNPELSIAMAATRVEEGFDAGADLLVSACPACKLNLNKGRASVDKEKRRVKVMDLSEVLAKAL